MIDRRSFIIGIKSFKLNKKETSFLKKYKPWGVILFTRNINTINQVSDLTKSIRLIFKDNNYPILIDQEGGRVNRLKKFTDTSSLSSKFFGDLYIKNKNRYKLYYNIYIKQTSYLLNKIGVNINTVPVLDVRRNNASKIIGDRSYSGNTKIVNDLGIFCIKEFQKNKIGTVVKHIPGHGLALVDSHKLTPSIKQKFGILNKIDFLPFRNKSHSFAMTAHAIYSDIDKINTATHSKKTIDIIRKIIKFNNLIISDDISMKALKYSIKINTIKAFEAGCNIVLHCNAKYNEMIIVAQNSPNVNDFIIKKTSQFYKFLS